MNKSINITAKISIEIDYKYKYGDIYAPLFGVDILQEAQRIAIFYERSVERSWESSSAEYLNYPTEPHLSTSYIPEEHLAYYITDDGLKKLVKQLDNNHFDYNYIRIKQELLHMEKEFNLKYGIIFDKSIVQIMYDLFSINYVNGSFSGSGIYTELKGIRSIGYTVDKNIGIIINKETE